eukprot:1248322-Amorphochlora_amoeboformis.AAC.1
MQPCLDYHATYVSTIRYKCGIEYHGPVASVVSTIMVLLHVWCGIEYHGPVARVVSTIMRTRRKRRQIDT